MTKEELALEVIDRLKKEYPDAGCTLDYDQAWKLLVSVSQRPFSSAVYRCKSECGCGGSLCKVSGCGISGKGRTGGD